MKIQPITHNTLAETVAGKLATSLLDGSLVPGSQLPSERDLMNQLGVSRATLREALKALEESRLIEARPNVGWFVHAIDEANVTKARELANVHGTAHRRAPPRTNRQPVRCAYRSPPKSRCTSPTCTPTAWELSSSSPGGSVKRFKTPTCWWSEPARWATTSSRTWR